MGWVRISDDFYDHPAHAVLGLEEWGLWVWGLAWSNRNLTDGVIPWPVVKRMDPDGDATGALMEAGRWVDCDEGNVEIHDYLDWQPSAEQVRSKREKERRRWQHRADSAATPRGGDAEDAATPPASQPQPQEKETSAATAAVAVSDWDEWWKGYPQKRDKSKAREAYYARRRAGTSHEDLIAARDHYVAAEGASGFVKYGATFLRGKDGPWSEWVAGTPAPSSPPTLNNQASHSRFADPARAVLGRGLDAAPSWELNEAGDAVEVR